jgi:signal peptide peptidase SppA
MKAPLIHVASMVFNTPLAIIPEKLEVILATIGPRLVVDDSSLDQLLRLHFIETRPVLRDDAVIFAQMPEEGRNRQEEKPYRLTPEGIAVIPVRGTLMKRFGYLSAISGCSSYAGLQQATTAALADPQVKGVLFDVDSPGGTTHGCFELSEALYQMRGDKPIWAIANDLAASAAYALASSADRLLVTRTAGVGSVGVFALHADQSGADAQAGVKYTYVFAGDKKTDGNPHEALSKSARADIQAEVDREYAMFVGCVARNRGFAGADAEAVQKTEAAVSFGQNAVGLLADEVATLDEALEAMAAKVNGSKAKSPGKVASKTEVGNNARNLEGAVMPAIAPHHTATSTKSWDGPKAKKNLRQDEDASYYRSAYAFAKPGQDPKTKAGYSYIHHEVSSSGEVGAANIKACQTSIGVLNGGRGGTVLKGSDRRGVYNHVAAHLRDAKLEPAPLASYEQYIAGVLAFAEETQDDQLHGIALVYLLAEAEEPKGEVIMAKKGTEDMRRAKSEAEDAEAVDAAEEKDDEEEEDEEEDEKKKKDEDDEAESRRGKKGEGRKGRRGEGKDMPMDDDEDEDEDDKKKSRRGEVTELPVAANSPKRIAELCQIAGAPELAADYLIKGYSVDRVIEKLSARRVKASAEGGVASYVTGQGGSGGARASVDTAIEQARVMAANSGGKMSQSQCMERILRSNPDIYSGYLEERGAVAAQVAFTGGGRALNDYVLNHQRRYMTNLGLSTVIDDVPGRRAM